MYGNHGFVTASSLPSVVGAFYVGWWSMAVITALFLLVSLWQFIRPSSEVRP